MKSLNELPVVSLMWKKGSSVRPGFELHGKEGIFATLTFQDQTLTLARVDTAEGAWTFKHLGLIAPVVTVRTEGGTTNLATFHPHALRHGKLHFHDGKVHDWVWLHEAVPSGAFLDPEGMPLLRLRARELSAAPELEQCEVDLGLASANRSRLALLAALGWYLILFDHMKERDAVSAETALRL